MTILKFLTAATETWDLFSEAKQRAPACADHQYKTSCHLLAETATLHIGIAIARSDSWTK